MRRIALLAALFGVCLAQTPTPPVVTPPAAISAYYRLAGNATDTFPYQWLVIDAPLALSFDGTSPHLSVGAITSTTTYGAGFIVATSAIPPQIALDTSYVSFRTAPPAAAGPCVDPLGGAALGSGAWAVDGAFAYFCVPDAAGDGGLVWGRAAVATVW